MTTPPPFQGAVRTVSGPVELPPLRRAAAWVARVCGDFPGWVAGAALIALGAMIDTVAAWVIVLLALAALIVRGVTARDQRAERLRSRRMARRWRGDHRRIGLAASAGLLSRTGSVPELLSMTSMDGHSDVIELALPAGMHTAEVETALDPLAHAWGAIRARIIDARPGRVHIRLMYTDPLDGLLDAELPESWRTTEVPIPLGMREDGAPFELDLRSAAHVLLQGQTGSGKSSATYVLLSWVLSMRDAELWGIDPTALLWSNAERFPGRRVSGTDPEQHLELLTAAVDEMNRRIATLSELRTDSVSISEDVPLIVLVLEEFPGIISGAEQHDKATGARTDARIAPRLRLLLGKLVAEGRKAGIRVVLLAQRADAEVIDGRSRSNFTHLISLRTDSAGVAMLHPTAEPSMLAGVPPGRGLAEGSAMPLSLVQLAYMGGYGDYLAQCDRMEGLRFGSVEVGHAELTGTSETDHPWG